VFLIKEEERFFHRECEYCKAPICEADLKTIDQTWAKAKEDERNRSISTRICLPCCQYTMRQAEFVQLLPEIQNILQTSAKCMCKKCYKEYSIKTLLAQYPAGLAKLAEHYCAGCGNKIPNRNHCRCTNRNHTMCNACFRSGKCQFCPNQGLCVII
jgi:hypothetical protein